MTTSAGEHVQLIESGLQARRAGAGMWGSVYRGHRNRRWYRLIPTEELDLSQRNELRQWQERPRRPDLAPIVDDGPDQRQFGDLWFRVVTYEVDAEHSLADLLADPDPRIAVEAISATFRALPDWWTGIGTGLSPMPTDIVLAGTKPLLLATPLWGTPSIDAILAEPDRAAYLSPEIVRGTRDPERSTDLYSLSVMALSCFAHPVQDTADRLIHQAACAHRPSQTRLPFWMSRVATIDQTYRRLVELTNGTSESIRTEVDPRAIADLLDRARKVMDPRAAIGALCDDGRLDEAVALAHSLPLSAKAYDAFLLAADIAKSLGARHEALSLLDRAVLVDPGRLEAYGEQIRVISDLVTRGRYEKSLVGELDNTIRTAFDRFPARRRQPYEHDLAEYLIARCELTEANEFLYRVLHDETGTLLWWRLDLMLDYTETFLLLGLTEHASRMVASVKTGIQRLRATNQMPARELHRHGMRLARLEQRLHEGSKGPCPGGARP